VDERLRFVARLMEGEKMAELCREFDISRKTSYKIFNRYKGSGPPQAPASPPGCGTSHPPSGASGATWEEKLPRLWRPKGVP
jgi:transposase